MGAKLFTGGSAPRVLVVAGTRPEAIKLAPVIAALRARSGIRTIVCATGQHRELLAEALALFGIEPDIDLRLMRPAQSADAFLAAARPVLRQAIASCDPRMLIVQGDTASALAGAQAAAASGVAVGHVEAGLRSGDLASPYPEEIFRRAISRLAALHFAPTHSARDALRAEGVAGDRIHVTGNSGIDALHAALARLDADPRLAAEVGNRFAFLDGARPLVLVTAHRRESFGAPLAAIVAAVRRLAETRDAQILLPAHPNPTVRQTVERGLTGVAGVHLAAPLDYFGFVHCLRRAHLVLTDSGGIQEEAPALGVPALVMRDTTERPEGIASGNARLVGTATEAIVDAAVRLLDDEQAHAAMANARSPYGDGHAAERIAGAIRNWLAEAALTQPREAALA